MGQRRSAEDALRLVHRSALWLGLLLVAIKAVYLGLPRALGLHSGLGRLQSLVAISHADVFFTVVLWACTTLLFVLARRVGLPAHRLWLASVGFVGLATAAAFTAVVSLGVLSVMGGFLTYPMLQSVGSVRMIRSSVEAQLTLPIVAALVTVPLAYLAAVYLTQVRARATGPSHRKAAMVAVAALAWVLAGHSAFASEWAARQEKRLAQNSHWVLLASWWARDAPHSVRLSDEYAATDLEDFEPPGLRAAAAGTADATTASAERPLNVILVVLESVAARWTSLDRFGYESTPTLRAEASRGIVFENFYAHVGRSSNSLAALLLSAYPKLGFRDMTEEYPRLPGTSIASLFRDHGYHTGFITPSNLAWAAWGRFLSARGFDDVRDERDLPCPEEVSSWGVEDRCMVDDMIRWMDESPSRPFFLMTWTQQTHHPYEMSPGVPVLPLVRDAVVDAYAFSRYLNVLHETDRQLGRVFDAVRRAGRENDTLIVVTGDHGQAFGYPHMSFMQGRTIYEEDVRVPLVLWLPRAYRAPARSLTIGSHVDLAPTIAELAGLPPAPEWQGRSLLAAGRPPRAYFYVAEDEFRLGVREDRWKYILDLRDGTEELFDLSLDAREWENVAGQHPDICLRLRRRLAAWTEANRRQYERVSGDGDIARVQPPRPPGQ